MPLRYTGSFTGIYVLWAAADETTNFFLVHWIICCFSPFIIFSDFLQLPNFAIIFKMYPHFLYMDVYIYAIYDP